MKWDLNARGCAAPFGSCSNPGTSQSMGLRLKCRRSPCRLRAKLCDLLDSGGSTLWISRNKYIVGRGLNFLPASSLAPVRKLASAASMPSMVVGSVDIERILASWKAVMTFAGENLNFNEFCQNCMAFGCLSSLVPQLGQL